MLLTVPRPTRRRRHPRQSGLGFVDSLIGGAISAVGAVGAAAITADAAKSISKDQEKASLAKTLAAQNLALSQEEKASATDQLQLEIGAQQLFEKQVSQQAGLSKAGQAVVLILVTGGFLALTTLVLRKS